MGKVLDALLRSENALLESPTGTGKTLCLLCATLAWQREQARKLHSQEFPDTTNNATSAGGTKQSRAHHRVPTIIYASRTHSQLSQVVRELRNTRYRPKHAVLGSRDQMCINPKVKKAASTASEVNHDCNKLGQERKCRFRNKLEGFVAPSNESSSNVIQPVRDMEELLTMGNAHKICPFYYTRSLVEDAELVLVPYNYLFDKDSRTTTLADVPWNNAVLIFDEAHNLESFASESASFDLKSTDIAGCVSEIQRALGYMENMGIGQGRLKEENVIKLKSIFLSLEEYIMNMTKQSAYRGEFMMEIFQKGARICHANHELFISEIRKVMDIFMEVQGGSSRGAPRLEHFVQCVKRVFGESTEARCIAKAQSYRVHVTPKTNSGNNNHNAGRTVSYWCFAPSEAMRELADLNVRSILVTSGTLSPLESYALELDLPFPNRIENPHIIPDDQIHVRVVGKGVSGKLLTSSYQRRQDEDYYTELGNTLVSLGKVIAGGMLIFFPSYGVMETCLEKWGGPANSSASRGKPTNNFFAARKRKSTGSSRYSFPYAPTMYSATKEVSTPWKRLLATKSVVIEPKTSADLPDAIAEFQKFLGMPKSKGVALFGVCRGKISEGIDFADDMCRAVIITGLPFAPSFDPKVKMKREFLDQSRASQNVKASTNGGFGAKQTTNVSLSGHEWYTQQAHRAVNQAIGRVIRNKNDYGAILLLDARFSQPGNQQGLSKWVRPHIKPDEGMGPAIGGLVKFYKNAAEKVRARQREAPPPRTPNAVSIILKYEEEEGKENQNQSFVDEEFTKVAIIGMGAEDQSGGTPSTIGAKTEGNTDASPNKSYIPADRIIARVDMKTVEGTQKFTSALQQDVETKTAPAPEASLRLGLDAESKPKPHPLSQPITASTSKLYSSTPANNNRAKQSGGSPAQTAAQNFFQQVQSRMSPVEQSSIKKSVVSMKRFTDQHHRKAFVSAASEIVSIILAYDTFENRPKGDPPELMALLFKLLPKHFIRDAQKYTMFIMLAKSEFGQSQKAFLSPGDCRRFQSDTSLLLWEIWFDSDNDVSPISFLRRLKTILDPILKQAPRSTNDVLRLFLKLIPLEYHSPTNGFIDQLTASRNMSRMKKMEKGRLGEDSVQIERFRAGSIKKEGSLDQQAAKRGVKSISDSSVPKTEVQNASAPISGPNSDQLAQSKKRVNPYERKSIGNQQKLKPEMSAPNYASRPEKVRRGLSLGSLVDSKQSQKRDAVVSLKNLLHQSESDTYTGKEKMNVTSSMKSNAPKNLTCTICEKSPSECENTSAGKVSVCTKAVGRIQFFQQPYTISFLSRYSSQTAAI